MKAYYQRLSVGCGSGSCTNEYCRSSPRFRSLPADDLPKIAVDLAKRKAALCRSLNGKPDSDVQSPPPSGQRIPDEPMCARDEAPVAAAAEHGYQTSGGLNSGARSAVDTATPVEHAATADEAACDVLMQDFAPSDTPMAMDQLDDNAGNVIECATCSHEGTVNVTACNIHNSANHAV